MSLYFFEIIALISILLFFSVINWYKERRAKCALKLQNYFIKQQSAELKKRDKLKSRFFAHVSPRMRASLMMVITPIGEVLQDNDLNPKNTDRLKKAQANGLQLLSLVDEMLDKLQLRVEEDQGADYEPMEVNPSGTVVASEPADAWLRRLRAMVREHLCSPQFNVDHLAELMGVSRTALYRRVHKRTNLSANQFIQELRLSRACELLESRQYTTLHQVASAVGFRSADYFSRLYRARFGKSPVAYFQKE